MDLHINNLPEMKPFRRKLRKQMTASEVALWLMIKNKQLDGERFLRQYSIGHFVVDFYCPKHKLAVELDGEAHFTDESEAYDAKRTAYLNSVGVRVLRFENFEVFQFPTRTLDEIRKYLK
jgi:very-short-patch-repair endonuclease